MTSPISGTSPQDLINGLNQVIGSIGRNERKTESKRKIKTLLDQAELKFTSFNPEQIREFHKLLTIAKTKDLLPASAKGLADRISKLITLKTTLYATDRNVIIKTRNGDVPANKEILMEKSEMFKAMFERWKKDETTVKLEAYSKETIEYLMRYLHSSIETRFPEETEIVIGRPGRPPKGLPKDNDVVLELIDLALTYDFKEMIKKLGPAVTEFIETESKTIEENMDDLLQLFKEHSGNYIVSSWLTEITPYFLKDYGIDVLKTNDGKYKIPADRIDLLLNKDAMKMLQNLPVVLETGKNYNPVSIKEDFEDNPIDFFEKLKAAKETKDKMCQTLVTALAEKGDFEKAIELARINPSDQTFGILANLIFENENTDKAIALVNTFPMASGDIADAMAKQGNVANAFKLVNAISDSVQKNILFSDIGEKMVQRKEFDNAEKFAAMILSHEIGSIEDWNGNKINIKNYVLGSLAVAMAKAGKFERAYKLANAIPDEKYKNDSIRYLRNEFGAESAFVKKGKLAK